MSAITQPLPRPPLQRMQNQIHTEINMLIDSKIQNHEVIAVFHQIERAKNAAENIRREAMKALDAVDLARVRHCLAALKTPHDDVARLTEEGLTLEVQDVARDNQRTDFLRIRQEILSAERKFVRPVDQAWRP